MGVDEGNIQATNYSYGTRTYKYYSNYGILIVQIEEILPRYLFGPCL